MSKHLSRGQARNKEMVKRSCTSKRSKAATDGPNIRQRTKLATRRWYIILASQTEQGSQRMAATFLKGPGSRQGDGQSFIASQENKACNKLQKQPSKDQARTRRWQITLASLREGRIVNHSCISTRARLATYDRNINQRLRLASRRWQIILASQRE